MKDVMGLINLHENEELLKDIIERRPVAAVPFGGRYRIIDFILSNMINSGIPNVGILIKKENDRSLMDHLRSGKEWDLARKQDGLFLLPPAHEYYASGHHGGDLRNFYTHLDYIQKSRQKYLLIASSHVITNMDFHDAFAFHNRKNADITLIYKELNPDVDDFQRCTVLSADADGRITDMEVNPLKINSHKVSMEMYIIEKTLLLHVINRCMAKGGTDFVQDALIRNINNLKIYGFPHEGRMARIYSVNSYYRQSMELLKPEVWSSLFVCPGRIYTKVKDEAPAKYKDSAQVVHSLIADGCIIEGRVENSILFRAVKVGKNACIKNSIIMQQCEVKENATLDYAILDKNVHITDGKSLKGEKTFPLVIRKNAVV